MIYKRVRLSFSVTILEFYPSVGLQARYIACETADFLLPDSNDC